MHLNTTFCPKLDKWSTAGLRPVGRPRPGPGSAGRPGLSRRGPAGLGAVRVRVPPRSQPWVRARPPARDRRETNMVLIFYGVRLSNRHRIVYQAVIIYLAVTYASAQFRCTCVCDNIPGENVADYPSLPSGDRLKLLGPAVLWCVRLDIVHQRGHSIF